MADFGFLHLLDSFTPVNPKDTEQATVQGDATRQTELLFSYLLTKTTLLKDLFPGMISFLTISSYTII